MSNILFTSDTHFFHENIVKLSNRPFTKKVNIDIFNISTKVEVPSYEVMHETLIKNWNNKVAKGDLVIHVGDFALTWGLRDQEKVENLLNQLNGCKILVKGNHDRKAVTKANGWSKVCDYYELSVKIDTFTESGLPAKQQQKICISHYPFRTWNGIGKGSWMLHGHSHGNLRDNSGKILDVGVDCHNYTPINLEEVTEIMKTKQVYTCDHHVTI